MLVLGQTSHPGMRDLALLAVGGHQLLVWLPAAWVRGEHCVGDFGCVDFQSPGVAPCEQVVKCAL